MHKSSAILYRNCYFYTKFLRMPIIRLDPDSPMGRQLQQLQTLYYALLSAPLVLFLIFYLQASQANYQPYLLTEGVVWLHVLVWVFVVVVAALVVNAYNKRVKAYAGPAELDQKFNHYTAESRRLYFMLAPLMFLPALAIWATGVILYGALFALLLILFAAVRPTVEQFIMRYRLGKEEVDRLTRLT